MSQGTPKSKRPRRSWRRRLVLYAALILPIPCLMIAFVLYAWAVPMGDFAPVAPRPVVASVHRPIVPERQLEKHTCGYHAISSIYRSYDLGPAERRLRARLGVDREAIVYDSETTGSLHPDIYRVLDQDGFHADGLALDDSDAASVLQAHVNGGHYALALIERPPTGAMHWVVVAGLKGHGEDTLVVCDSLAPERRPVSVAKFLKHGVLSVILIRPTTDPMLPVWRLHFRGTVDMWRALRRRS